MRSDVSEKSRRGSRTELYGLWSPVVEPVERLRPWGRLPLGFGREGAEPR